VILVKYKQCTYKRNVKTGSHYNCSRVKVISITYSECVSVFLDIQRATPMRRIILSSVVCVHLPEIYALSHKRYIFQEKKLYKIKFVSVFSEYFV